eukprot:gnl/TRDRNA2_/TRDRNA2_161485_c4_seq1.p2 gnl/TRDRNA2_/TRDRNA2_161485_c4~~gnl/TRDRNA2_/TRDRNA2_161485_c4_seq1.p2  ORF type:complete len:107 (+),score=20.38 gnl/TRDRNA2_/TRDRNA2_161485_c4_seq1:2-322(+)
MEKAVSLVELIKRRVKGLHQITALDPYCMQITLSTDPLNTADKGYQPPIQDSLVSEFLDNGELDESSAVSAKSPEPEGKSKVKQREVKQRATESSLVLYLLPCCTV